MWTHLKYCTGTLKLFGVTVPIGLGFWVQEMYRHVEALTAQAKWSQFSWLEKHNQSSQELQAIQPASCVIQHGLWYYIGTVGEYLYLD